MKVARTVLNGERGGNPSNLHNINVFMPKERNKADDYREKAYQGDTKAMNKLGVIPYPHGRVVRHPL